MLLIISFIYNCHYRYSSKMTDVRDTEERLREKETLLKKLESELHQRETKLRERERGLENTPPSLSSLFVNKR